jgi:hypothetical protein
MESGPQTIASRANSDCDAAPRRRAWLISQRDGNLAFYLDGE